MSETIQSEKTYPLLKVIHEKKENWYRTYFFGKTTEKISLKLMAEHSFTGRDSSFKIYGARNLLEYNAIGYIEKSSSTALFSYTDMMEYMCSKDFVPLIKVDIVTKSDRSVGDINIQTYFYGETNQKFFMKPIVNHLVSQGSVYRIHGNPDLVEYADYQIIEKSTGKILYEIGSIGSMD